MKKIVFISSLIYPSAQANRIHVLAMVKAFQQAHFDVTLTASNVELRASFKIKNFNTTNLVLLSFLTFNFLRKSDAHIIYCREPRLFVIIFILSSFFLRKDRQYFFEIHDSAKNVIDSSILRFAVKKSDYVVVLNEALKQYIIRDFRLQNSKKILVFPDAVDITDFDRNSSGEFFPEFNIQHPIVMYCGSFAWWKGVPMLMKAAQEMSEINFVLIGGSENEIKTLKAEFGELKNVFFTGRITHEDVPKFLKKSDVLVLPNSGEIEVSKYYTSPLKMFEYMAAEKPILASNLPSITQILEDNVTARLFRPDDPVDFKLKLGELIEDKKFADKIAQNARKKVSSYTWLDRVTRISNYMKF